MLSIRSARPDSPASNQDLVLAPWERWAGHAGYVAEGVFYLPLGTFALLAAVGDQQPNGAKGALAKVGQTMIGDALLAVLAVGLGGFVLWQFILAIADPEHRAEQRTLRRWGARLAHFLNGLFHCVFVGEAVWSAFNPSGGDSQKQSQVRWTGEAFALPVGQYLVGLVGAGIVMFGLWQFYRAVTSDKNKRVDLSGTRFRLAICTLGVYGLLARGTLFGLVGGYLVDAAWRHDPRYSGGVVGALGELKRQPYGAWMLGVMAVGLLCFGLYQIAKEPYRRLGRS